MRRALTPAIAALLMLAGCSGAQPDGNSGPTASHNHADDGASIEQFAGKVAAVKSDVEDWIDDWEGATCSSIAVDQGAADCHAYAVAGSNTAEAAYLDLDGLTSEQNSNYLGDPPAEIAELYESTVETAKTASDAGKAFHDADCESEAGCLGEVHRLASSMDDLKTKLTEWSPYM